MSRGWTRRRFLATGRTWALGMGAGLAAGVGSAQQRGAQTAPGVSYLEVRIGTSGAFGSVHGEASRELLRGSLAWFDEVNARRGIGGRRLTLLAQDDGGDPDRCARVTAELLSGGVLCLFGYAGTASILRAASVIRGRNDPDLVLLGALSGARSLDRPPLAEHFLSARPSLADEVETLLAPLLATGRRRLGLYLPLDPDGRALAQAVRQQLRSAGAEPPVETSYRPAGARAREPEAAAAHLASRGVEAVVCSGGAGACADGVRWLREVGWRLPVLLDSRVDGEAVLERLLEAPPAAADLGPLVQARSVPVFPQADADPSVFAADHPELALYLRLLEKWQPRVPEALAGDHGGRSGPSVFGFEGFRHARLLTEALDRAGPEPDRRSFRQALLEVSTASPEKRSAALSAAPNLEPSGGEAVPGGDPTGGDSTGGDSTGDDSTLDDRTSTLVEEVEGRASRFEPVNRDRIGFGRIYVARVQAGGEGGGRWIDVDWSPGDSWVAGL